MGEKVSRTVRGTLYVPVIEKVEDLEERVLVALSARLHKVRVVTRLGQLHLNTCDGLFLRVCLPAHVQVVAHFDLASSF